MADGNNARIRRLWANNTLATLFQAGLVIPYSISFDGVGGYLITDTFYNQLKRQLPTNGQSTLTGNTTRGFADGTSQAMLFNPYFATPDPTGSGGYFIADYSCVIRALPGRPLFSPPICVFLTPAQKLPGSILQWRRAVDSCRNTQHFVAGDDDL